jgi:hypothetical protein
MVSPASGEDRGNPGVVVSASPPKVSTPKPHARSLATAALRRARSSLGVSQEELGQRLATTDRVVRRRESGKSDLGVLESALLHPPFARALAAELLLAADRAEGRHLTLVTSENDELKEAA